MYAKTFSQCEQYVSEEIENRNWSEHLLDV